MAGLGWAVSFQALVRPSLALKVKKQKYILLPSGLFHDTNTIIIGNMHTLGRTRPKRF